jgi:S1-C subfamily serine protease
MVARSGQQGVPVIDFGDEVVVGFDEPRLERLAARERQRSNRPRIGLLAKDLPGGGIEVGGTRPGSPAERAGFQKGDVVQAIDGKPVTSMADLERLISQLPHGVPLMTTVRRNGSNEQLTLTI